MVKKLEDGKLNALESERVKPCNCTATAPDFPGKMVRCEGGKLCEGYRFCL